MPLALVMNAFLNDELTGASYSDVKAVSRDLREAHQICMQELSLFMGEEQAWKAADQANETCKIIQDEIQREEAETDNDAAQILSQLFTCHG